MNSGATTNLKYQLRLLAILLGVVCLVWLPFEDLNENWAILLAVAIASLAACYILIKIPHRKWPIYPLAGLLAGLAVMPLAIALMIFKSGVHSHGFPDFTPNQMLDVIRLSPVIIFAGLLIGSGIGLLFLRQLGSGGPENGRNG